MGFGGVRDGRWMDAVGLAMFGWLELGCGFWLSWNGWVRDSVGLSLIGCPSDGIGFARNMSW